MSLWYCTKCGWLMINSMVCRCGCGETLRVNHVDTNGRSLEDSGIIEHIYSETAYPSGKTDPEAKPM